MMIPIRAFNDNYIWISSPDKHSSVFCVDPGDSTPVIAWLKETKSNLAAILITHHHADHCGGVSDLIDYNPNVIIYGPADNRIPSFSQLITNNSPIEICNFKFDIIQIPGHTSSHIAFYEKHQEWLFCGDTLFSAGCGRVFDGTLEQLANSLAKLASLPNSTQVFCGHEYTRDNLRFATTVEPNNSLINTYSQYLLENPNKCSLPSTIEEEKKINPFLRLTEPEVVTYALQHGVKSPDSLSVFSLLRANKNQFT